MSLLNSVGLKRRIASLLSVVLGVVTLLPNAGAAVLIIQQVASFFGVTGLVHATAMGTLSRDKLSGIVSAISALIALAHFVPVLSPAIVPLQTLAALLGAAALGTGASK